MTMYGVVTEKGGSGKTTFSVHLSRGIQVLSGEKVTLIDNDPQQGSARWFSLCKTATIRRPQVISVDRPVTLETLASIGIKPAENSSIVLDGAPGLDVELRLRDMYRLLEEVKIDAGCSDELRARIQQKMRNILGHAGEPLPRAIAIAQLADIMLVPMVPSDQDLNAGIRHIKKIHPITERRGTTLAVVLTQTRPGTKLYKETRDKLEKIGVHVIDTPIRTREIYRRLSGLGYTIFDAKSMDAKAHLEMEKIITEVLDLTSVAA